ncbi:MAG: 4Fe-4S binding protein [Candidatus Omnitrophica bacterium]|nr:4Fe-4S binding protein [Candidatus Omnitrophota bacterium]
MAKIVINAQKCKGCLLCVSVCPNKMITLGKKINSKGAVPVIFKEEGQCSGCSLCALVCPDCCIEVYK